MFIKLTHVSGIKMIVNSDNIVQFFSTEESATTLLTVDGGGDVVETPEQICEMLGVDFE